MNKSLPESIRIASSPVVAQPTSIMPSMPHFSKNFMIIVLLGLLILALLGINVFIILGTFIQTIILPILISLWNMIAYSLGFTIDKTSEVAASTTKSGIDIADGVLDSVGHLLMASSGISSTPASIPQPSINAVIDKPRTVEPEVKPDSHDSSIQKPIVADKSSWCYIGTHNGTRGCVEIGEQDKCMSGLLYESKSMCLATRK